jgi:tRNA-binding EMAP/Myf-like protein
MGTDTKISIAGLKEFYHPNVLLNKNVVVVTNLESAKIRGIISECMLLAAVDENNVSLLVPEKEVSPGSLITTSTTKKVSFKDFKKIELRTGTVIDWNKDIAKVDIKDRIIDAFCKSRCINKKVVVFLSTKIKNKGLVLAVDDVLITVDTPIGNGVRIE